MFLRWGQLAWAVNSQQVPLGFMLTARIFPVRTLGNQHITSNEQQVKNIYIYIYISVYAAFVGPTRRISLNSTRVDVRRL